jgi:transposase
MLLADRGYDADWIRALVANCAEPICFKPYFCRARNLVGRFFNKIKRCRRVTTRYDKLAAKLPSLYPTRINTAVAAR